MRRAAIVLVLALGCGVKAAPLPPLREPAPPADGGSSAPTSSAPSTSTSTAPAKEPTDGGTP